ncbi:MAG: EamA family transporter [Ferrovibrio sp.]|uniref:DMT family transporter n=1 Tax=Ferrovibrio sp. TaxID=1917215 RepID=UPI00260A4BA3|nr:EamA family transporter [Ferrovibrio sp.]MCW0234451.1 EamA family transporter [Ferrovibrio sp.]
MTVATAVSPPRPLIVEFLLLAVLATLWGASYTFIKLGVATIPPITLIAARTMIAGGLLLCILRLRGIGLPRDAATWRHLAIQACINSVLPFTLIAWAEIRIEAGLATILNATTPIFAFLITWAITRHEAVTARKLFGTVMGLGGVCMIIGVGVFTDLGSDLWGQLAMLLASLSYGVAAIYGHNFRHLDSMVPATGSMLCGAAMLVPLSLIVDRPWTLSPSQNSLLALLALAVFSTALAFVIYFRLVRTLGSVGTTSQAYLRIPIGVGIGVVFLGESLAGSAWLGLIFVVIGVAAMSLPARKAV